MVKLKERKLKYILNTKDKKNNELAFLLGVKIRRLQQLKAEYKKTGMIPKLKKDRRPKTMLKEEDEQLIDKALTNSKLEGAVLLRLYIQKYYHKNIPKNKLHEYLLIKGISKTDRKKQGQRIYRPYQRNHTFSLVHLDWHESRAVKGKQVCVVEDDASRKILSGGEFDNSFEEHNIKLIKEAIELAYKNYSAGIREVNTDKGTQFYANNKTNDGERGRTEFEKYLESKGIKHIPSRRNHPQTNGKNERWFRTYEENRDKFNSFEEFIKWYNNKINLGLNRKEGITPNEAAINKLQPESILGLFFRRFK